MEDYTIYKEIERVPIDVEHVRSAFNMSVGTTEQLKKFSKLRRIPLQKFSGISGYGSIREIRQLGGNQND